MLNLDSILKSTDITNKGPSSQSYGFSSGHVWMWELDYKENWALKNWWFWTVVLGKTLESPLDCKEIQPVHLKGDQSWVFIGRTDAEAETPILWPPDAKNWLIGKVHYAGKDWGQEEKGVTEFEMVGWHHWLDGHVFEQAPGDGEGQGSLVSCSPCDHKESDTTEWLNSNSNWVQQPWTLAVALQTWIAFGLLLLCHGNPHITWKFSDFLPAYLLYWFPPPRSNAGFHVSGCRVLTILQVKF